MKSVTALPAYMSTVAATVFWRSVHKLICHIFGHCFVNRSRLETPDEGKLCCCGEPLLRADEAPVHVRHNLACFLGGHSYTKIGERANHCEYVCRDCGHPLLLKQESSPLAHRESFHKFVRHRCGWFGHVVHKVAERCGLTEYACHCGHSFLLQVQGLKQVRHPSVCVLTGHRICLLTRRDKQLEFRCQDCGHPFCLADEADQFHRPLQPRCSAQAAHSHCTGL